MNAARDCDDRDPRVYPGAPEIPWDGLDNDCQGGDLIDVDGDGYAGVSRGTYTGVWPDGMPDSTDCADDPSTVEAAQSIYPGADDPPYDGIDQDCGADEEFDADGDGHLPELLPDGRDAREARGAYLAIWAPGLPSAPYDDCDDADASIYGGAPDTPYDAVDADCAGDDDYDGDGDGWLPDEATWGAVRTAWIEAEWSGNPPFGTRWGDCRDVLIDGVDPAAVYPMAADIPYDGIDHDCQGDQDFDADEDGFVRSGDEALALQFDRTWGGDGQWEPGDCDDADSSIHPGGLERLNDRVDSNCDGADGVSTLVFDEVAWTGIGAASVATTGSRVVVAATAADRDGAGPGVHLVTLDPMAQAAPLSVAGLEGHTASPLELLPSGDALDVVYAFTDVVTVLRVAHMAIEASVWSVFEVEDAFFSLAVFDVSDIDAHRTDEGTVTAWACGPEAVVVLETDGGPKLDRAAIRFEGAGEVCFVDPADTTRGTSCTEQGCRTWVHDRVWARLDPSMEQPWRERSPIDATLREGVLLLAEPGTGGVVVGPDQSWVVLAGEPVVGLDGALRDGLLTAVAHLQYSDTPEVVMLIGPPEAPEVIPLDTGGRVPVDVALHRDGVQVAVGLSLAGSAPGDDRLAWTVFAVE